MSRQILNELKLKKESTDTKVIVFSGSSICRRCEFEVSKNATYFVNGEQKHITKRPMHFDFF